MPDKPKRLAITISGAVSLGSYEAGVLYEVLTALAAHNAAQKNAGDKILVDVLTGASAGGMTAAIAGQMLAGNGTRKWEVFDNPFYNAWVKEVDLRALVQMRSGEDPMQSILSSDAVKEIADGMIPATWDPHSPHPAAAPELKLGLALTNLVGIDWDAGSSTGTPYIYTRYQDRLLADLRTTDAAGWDRIRAAALACGAFPVAFRVRELMRRYEDFFPDGGSTNPSWEKPFVYTDGGVFDNQPLGIARELVSQIDEAWDNDRRFYLFVSPWPKKSSLAVQPLQAKDATFLATMGALVSAVFNQARFRDWVTAHKTNRALSLLDERAVELALMLQADPDFAPKLKPVAEILAKAFTAEQESDNPGFLLQERSRLRKVFAQLVPTIGAAPVDYFTQLTSTISSDAADAWIDALLVFEYAGRLQDKAEMIIYGVTAADEELASGGISAFAGFFDERFRHHDYEVGRQKARIWLASLQAPAAAGVASLAPLTYIPDPNSAPNPDPMLRNLPIEDMPVGPRKMFLDAVTQRTDKMIDQYLDLWFGINWLAKRAAKNAVRNAVGKKLGL